MRPFVMATIVVARAFWLSSVYASSRALKAQGISASKLVAFTNRKRFHLFSSETRLTRRMTEKCPRQRPRNWRQNGGYSTWKRVQRQTRTSRKFSSRLCSRLLRRKIKEARGLPRKRKRANV